MNDDALHPDHELASAYLDNEVDATERAVVEGSPQLVELVATLQSVRTHIADVPPPSAVARDVAINAALAAFVVPDALAHRPSGARVIPLSGRRLWQRRILAGAAAAAVVAVTGIAVMSANRNDSKDSATVAEADPAPLDASRQETATATPPAASDAAPGDAVRPTIAVIGGAADVAIVIDSPEALLSLAAPKMVATGVPSTGDVAGAAGESYGANCIAADQQWLANIIYIGTVAVAVADPATGTVQALDAATCAVLAEVTP